MPTLPIFSGHERIQAMAGFLLGVLIPPVLISGAWHWLPSTQTAPGVYRFDGFALVLILGMLVLGMVALFWSLALLSNSAASGSSLVYWCGWIWITGIVARILVELVHRRFEPGTVLLLLLVILFRPRHKLSVRLWPSGNSLEERESTPFLWGASAAFGALGLASALTTMNLHSLGGFLGHALMAFSLLAEGFVLGVLLQTWTRQRWPGLIVAALVLLCLGIAWLLKTMGIQPSYLHALAIPAWPLGVLVADFVVSRDTSDESDQSENKGLTAPS